MPDDSFDLGALVIYNKLKDAKKAFDLAGERSSNIIKRGKLSTPYGDLEYQFRNMNLLGKRFVLDILGFTCNSATVSDLVKLCSSNKFCHGIHFNNVSNEAIANWFWERGWFRKHHPGDSGPSFFLLWEY